MPHRLPVERVWVRGPIGAPVPTLAVASRRAGAFPLVALGRGTPADLASMDSIERRIGTLGYGVMVGELETLDSFTPRELLERWPGISALVVSAPLLPALLDAIGPALEQHACPVVVEACGVGEVDVALAHAGERVAGVVAKGSESAGRVGDTGAFVLLQQMVHLLAGRPGHVPVWLQGGIGLHSAAAAVVGGAAGVVLDQQLALCRESALPADISAAIRAMDGSETVVLGGYRVYTRPDLPVAAMADALVSPAPDHIAGQLTNAGLRDGLVPMGQDASLAAEIARRFGTVGRAVQAIEASIDHLPGLAADQRVLSTSAPDLAAAGLPLPVFQGPMTRVSDQAAFAGLVATGGGLPFLALALLRGAEVRELLTATAALLGERPWGVGILGFVPPELRDEQLEVVREFQPPVALIAGGRPSQAAPLEADGTRTFLHVPSPGLLDRFLKDGARRFVFEGRECGGHVGPRTSFLLWEQQVVRLLAFADSGGTDAKGSLVGVHTVFAGGIHDARSAAMVATLAAPLVARGAAVNVLMGTAYLFTAEAVDGGAILPGFQQAAIECHTTVLLETSPGHATRCAESPYVETFREEKHQLVASGATAQEVWAELEQLNLGRLRIASKGLVRDGDVVVGVDPDTQRADGMFMIGDIATMRSQRTTVADLHREVTMGAVELLDAYAVGMEPPASVAPPLPLDVAIVGMSCVFPGAPNVEQFWANIVAGVDSVTEVPADRWDTDLYYDEHAFTENAGVKTPSKWGGFLPDVPFDALAYGIPPRSLASIEPVQLLALDVARQALADAGYDGVDFDRSRVSVIFGAEAGTDLSSVYGFRSLLPSFTGTEITGELDNYLPKLTEDSFPGLLTNVIAGRIANRLDLGGVNYTVDAACAASLAALDLACKELVGGTSDMVLCGGADLHNGINDYLLFASVHALSPTGRCRTFDADADGITLGEGVACVVLKRLADAERDGDRVYAVIKGVAGSSDGRHLGLTAPRKEGQQRALERAYFGAGIDPATVGLVEAHGTGTVVGDRTELATLTEVFTEAGATVAATTVGSVKSNIGHTKCAAGLAGLIKAANAVYRGIRPPTLHVQHPNSAYDADASPFRIDATAAPWTTVERVAGVSAFGFGGTNFHAVLARHDADDAPAQGLDVWPAELLLVRAVDPASASARLMALERWLDDAHDAGATVSFRDVAFTVCSEGSGPVQVAIVADSIADLRQKLEFAIAGSAHKSGVFVDGQHGPNVSAASEGSVAFLFPGQGSQRPGMLADLFVAFPWLHHHLEVGAPWRDVMYPPAAFSRESTAAQKAAITDTRVAQPALGIAGSAMAQLLASLGVEPHVAAGHSYGELTALSVAGAFDEAALVRLSAARGEAILAAAGDDPGTMAAASAAPETVDAVLAAAGGSVAGVVVANRNSPTQSVISGPTDAVAAAVAALAEAGIAAKSIAVACAFHSGVVARAATALAHELDHVEIGALRFPVWSNTNAAPYATDAAAIRATLAQQVAEPVRWVEQIEAMYDAGARVFVECGPGRVLSQLVGKILGDRPHAVVATDSSGDAGLRRLLLAVAELATLGVAVRTDVLFRERATLVDLRVPALSPPSWVLNGHLVRTRDGNVVPGGLRPFTEVPRGAAGLGVGGTAGGLAVRTPEKDASVVEYLRGMRELVATQREVMLRYLGAPAEAMSVFPPMIESSARMQQEAVPVGVLTATTGSPQESPVARSVLSAEELRAAVLAIVGERTGYPLDMLDPDLDLEADLSIDSIKRIEILGELADRVGLPGADGDTIDESVVEELAQIKTINGIVGWILERSDTDDDAESAAVGGAFPDGGPASSEDVAVPSRSLRFVPRLVDAPGVRVLAPSVLAGRQFVIVDDERGVALHVAALLEEQRASVRVVGADAAELEDVDEVFEVDGLIDLRAIAPESRATARELYPRVRGALVGGASWILAATAAGGQFSLGSPSDAASETGAPHEGPGDTGYRAGAGVAGMLQTAAREFTEVVVRAVDLDAKADPGVLAEAMFAELLLDGPVVVAHDGGVRRAIVIVQTDLGGGTAVEPSVEPPVDPPVRANTSRLPGPDGVALLTGGARGITAQVAIALAAQTGCRVVLAGRTPMPDTEETAALAGATDATQIRKALIADGMRVPAEIETSVHRTLAEREMRATMTQLADLGVDATYVAVDVCDAVALTSVVGMVRQQFGRLDLVVHGAGVLDDRLLRDKSPDAFARVFDTKVCGAGTLLAAIGPATTMVLFGSIAGVFGNRGQVDYAAANDALDGLARAHRRAEGPVVLSVDWGPWAGGGMVSAELEREYSRRGIGLVGQDEGVALLLEELRAGAHEPQVVFMRSFPAAFGRPVSVA